MFRRSGRARRAVGPVFFFRCVSHASFLLNASGANPPRRLRIDTLVRAIYRELMDEYEALAQAAVAALQAAAQPKWTDVLVAAGSVGGLVVGLLQCGLISIGLRRMGEAAADRKAQHDETMATLHETSAASQRQHEESMVALKTLIERTAPRP